MSAKKANNVLSKEEALEVCCVDEVEEVKKVAEKSIDYKTEKGAVIFMLALAIFGIAGIIVVSTCNACLAIKVVADIALSIILLGAGAILAFAFDDYTK